jgi:HD-GYP domain-containing protein (c-di-GMP phosphodiesterase class II)
MSTVSLQLFYPPARILVDTYLMSKQGRATMLFSSAAAPPTSQALDRLAAGGVKALLVPMHQVPALRAQLLQLCATNEDVSSLMRLEAAREEAKSSFANAWQKSEVDPLVRQASALAEGVLDACQGEHGVICHLIHLLHHDGSTFAHITNVCTYAMLLGQGLGVSDRDVLMELGTAALLHDVGKRQVACSILRKPGKLTVAEQRIIADHPRKGFEELNQRDDLSWAQLLMVYQHHEREDGSGYPVGIDSGEIHWMAKVCAIVDVFDALTARRAYRESASAAAALEHLDGESARRLDKELVKCWKAIVKKGLSSGV